jgi:hypothetical protein
VDDPQQYDRIVWFPLLTPDEKFIGVMEFCFNSNIFSKDLSLLDGFAFFHTLDIADKKSFPLIKKM